MKMEKAAFQIKGTEISNLAGAKTYVLSIPLVFNILPLDNPWSEVYPLLYHNGLEHRVT